MSIVTNTLLTFSVIGNREDLANEIFIISPTDVPFSARAAKTKATNTNHEWQLDTLIAAAANAQLEGDDSGSFTFTSATPTTRLSNNTQILRKSVIVSGTQQAMNPAGRKKEMVYQMMKRGKELRRDQEFVLTNNQTPVPNASASSSTARALRPIIAWASTNTSSTASGAAGSSVLARVDGSTTRAFTENLLKAQLQAAWQQGGDPDLIMVGPFNKTVASGFTGNNTRTQDTSDGKLDTAIDVYVSDFGSHKIVPNRFSRERDVHILTMDLWAVAALRPIQTVDLAKTGDAEKAMIIEEVTLECRNEAGSAWVFDVATQ